MHVVGGTHCRPLEWDRGSSAHTPTCPVCGARAVWVTHAGGVAAALAGAMAGSVPLPDGLDPARFRGRNTDELAASAMVLYRDIDANDAEVRG